MHEVKELVAQVIKVHKLQKERLLNTFTGKTDIEFVFDKNRKLLVPEWFEDYNEQAPHSAIAMMSPTEYYKTNLNQVA